MAVQSNFRCWHDKPYEANEDGVLLQHAFVDNYCDCKMGCLFMLVILSNFLAILPKFFNITAMNTD